MDGRMNALMEGVWIYGRMEGGMKGWANESGPGGPKHK